MVPHTTTTIAPERSFWRKAAHRLRRRPAAEVTRLYSTIDWPRRIFSGILSRAGCNRYGGRIFHWAFARMRRDRCLPIGSDGFSGRFPPSGSSKRRLFRLSQITPKTASRSNGSNSRWTATFFRVRNLFRHAGSNPNPSVLHLPIPGDPSSL